MSRSDITKIFHHYPFGFGRTRQERIVLDIATVLDRHDVHLEHHTPALVLAEFAVASLEARKASLSQEVTP